MAMSTVATEVYPSLSKATEAVHANPQFCTNGMTIDYFKLADGQGVKAIPRQGGGQGMQQHINDGLLAPGDTKVLADRYLNGTWTPIDDSS